MQMTMTHVICPSFNMSPPFPIDQQYQLNIHENHLSESYDCQNESHFEARNTKLETTGKNKGIT